MKKRIISIIFVIVAIIAIMSAIAYWQSFKNVTITIAKPNVTAVVYAKSNNRQVATTASSTTISLQTGDYYIIPKSDQRDTSKIPFTVKDTMTVTVNPGYARSFLDSQLASQLPAIQQVIRATYPKTNDYQLTLGNLYHEADWYATTLYDPSRPLADVDIYRIVLHKANGTWKTVTPPQLILSAHDHPSVPTDVLRAANKLL